MDALAWVLLWAVPTYAASVAPLLSKAGFWRTLLAALLGLGTSTAIQIVSFVDGYYAGSSIRYYDLEARAIVLAVPLSVFAIWTIRRARRGAFFMDLLTDAGRKWRAGDFHES